LKKLVLAVIVTTLCNPLTCIAYSILTHEAIIDANWKISIEPLLKQKYPEATSDQLKEAHAYAYGGAVTPDMGYFPFGSKLFTNLIHYIRSGDFVKALLDEAQNINEYAFALGALSHYNADHYGHPMAVNVSVPILYPKDREKYGGTVTYEEDHAAHLRMEFGFDVLQTARGDYASQAYHDFIGFKVSKLVLERAFIKTYGLDLHDVFKDFSLAVSIFRWSVKDMFPEITKAAWSIRKDEILKSNPNATSRNFIYKMSRANYHKEFGEEDSKPGLSASALALIIRILPKTGPLKSLNFKAPTSETEKLFVQSFDTVLFHYSAYIKNLMDDPIELPDINYDTGKKTAPGEYELADANYGTLLLMLKNDHFAHVTPELKQNILSFYSELDATGKNSKVLKDITKAIEELKVAKIKVAMQ